MAGAPFLNIDPRPAPAPDIGERLPWRTNDADVHSTFLAGNLRRVTRIAKTLGAADGDLLVGEQASEPVLRRFRSSTTRSLSSPLMG